MRINGNDACRRYISTGLRARTIWNGIRKVHGDAQRERLIENDQPDRKRSGAAYEQPMKNALIETAALGEGASLPGVLRNHAAALDVGQLNTARGVGSS